jgi:hypothetical protein
MGTNFYLIKKQSCDHCGRKAEEGPHVGKRSAAGLFCYACKLSLCVDGNEAVHRGHTAWAKACRNCGAEPVKDDNASGMVELGFAKPRTDKPSDVRSAASFTWAADPVETRNMLRGQTEALIIDEYGRTYSGVEFLAIIDANCPIEFTDSIGLEFS